MTARVLFCFVADFAFKNEFTWARQDTFAKLIGRSIRQTRTAFKELEAHGYLTHIAQPGNVNLYVATPAENRRTPAENCSSTPAENRSTTPAENRSPLQYIARENKQERKTAQTGPMPADKDIAMGKIIGGIRRVAPGNESRPAREPAPPDPVRDLAKQFAQKFQTRENFCPAALNAWRSLIKESGSQNKALQICEEAFQNKHRLLNDEHPVFGVHTVLFYLRYKRSPDIDAAPSMPAKLEALIKQFLEQSRDEAGQFNDLQSARKWFAVRRLRREHLRGICTESELEQLFPAVAAADSGTPSRTS